MPYGMKGRNKIRAHKMATKKKHNTQREREREIKENREKENQLRNKSVIELV